MINGQLNDFASASHLTQVASYFDIVDNAVRTGDTNKRYTISTNTSTAPSPPIAEGSWTNIHISPTADNMCDLYNSFIDVEMKFDMALHSKNSTEETATDLSANGHKASFWIGFKDAMDCIESYQIVANGQAIYTQSHAIEESYITNLACPDMVKRRDIFSKAVAKNIMEKPEYQMVGQLVEIQDGKISATHGTIDNLRLKIDIRRFLPLSGIKYLPAFVGNLELRVKFSTAGLVVLPMPWNDIYSNPCKVKDLTSIENITTCFTPATEYFKVYYTVASSALKAATVNCDVYNFSVTKCNSVLANFGIDDGIYQSLVQRYTGQSLSFPTQTLTFQAMNGEINKSSKVADLALTSTPRFVDTIFMLFPENTNYRTCYINPLFSDYRLTMGGYGSMPDIPTNSWGPTNYEMLCNALNGNNDLTGLAKDVMRSATLDPSLTATQQVEGIKCNDITNFVLAFPVSTDNTFQQGQTTSAPITYQFKANLNTNSRFIAEGTSCVPLMGFLKDSVFAIQLRPAGPPIIALDEFDISSPAGTE